MSELEATVATSSSKGVGRRIRELRRAAGLSLRTLATQLDLSAATISAIENGHTALTIDRLSQIAAALAVSPIDLLQTRPRTDANEPATNPPAASWRTFAPLEVDPVTKSAIHCFVTTGYHGANMRSIAAGAGLSVAGVYHHYASKQDLLVRILDVTMDELDWRLAAARDSAKNTRGSSDPLARLHALVEALALFHTLRPDLAFIGASEMRSLEPAARERIAARRSTIQRLIDKDIRDAIEAGVAHTPMPLETGRAISTMCTSLPQWFDPNGPTTPQQIATEYGSLALRMIGARAQAD